MLMSDYKGDCNISDSGKKSELDFPFFEFLGFCSLMRGLELALLAKRNNDV